MTHKTQLQYYIFVIKSILSQLCLIAYILPKPQVQASQFLLHISYLLQKCKKGKPCRMDLPLLKNDITSSGPTSKLWIYCSKHNFRARLCTPTYCVCHNNKKVQNNSDSLQSKRANKSED